MKPTSKQIKTEISELEKIKPTVRRCSVFGDDNWDAIDAQIDVLKHDLSEECIEERSHHEDEDESMMDDDSLWSENERLSAMEARYWMDGDEFIAPSEGWKPLIQK